ncbi:PilZ domain-containing protein [Ampullimonas aquatilis]|uniref:PilZ domain-containing protein n=2 Tax=Pseudomonadota TaxID=1224 RepID=UPI003C745BB3
MDLVLVPVKTGELKPGVPVPWSLYSKTGHMFAPAGFVIDSEDALKKIVSLRPLREAKGLEKLACAADEMHVKGLLRTGDTITDTLSDVKDNVETVLLTFSLPGDVEPRKIKVDYLGCVRLETIMLKPPVLEGRRSWNQYHGLEVNVIIYTQKSMFTFDSVILHSMVIPAAMLFVRYPIDARQAVYRKSIRVKTKLPAVAQFEDGRNIKLVITNLSEQGCGVESEYMLGEKDERFQLSFRTQIDSESFMLTMPVVIRSNGTTRSKMQTYGLEFQDTDHALDWTLKLALLGFIGQNLIR